MSERRFGPVLARVVRKRLRSLLDDADDAFRRGRDAELHALRIDAKRLRYTLECAVPLAPARALAAIDLLATLQERLGELADAGTFGRTYRTLAAGLAADDPRAAGIAALVASARRERTRALEAARTLWRGDGSPYPEMLAASIAATLESLSSNEVA
ncbi:MAG: hypothetical protein NVS1B2_14140 [Vulcanimicrobiaceae bacterium]